MDEFMDELCREMDKLKETISYLESISEPLPPETKLHIDPEKRKQMIEHIEHSESKRIILTADERERQLMADTPEAARKRYEWAERMGLPHRGKF